MKMMQKKAQQRLQPRLQPSSEDPISMYENYLNILIFSCLHLLQKLQIPAETFVQNLELLWVFAEILNIMGFYRNFKYYGF